MPSRLVSHLCPSRICKAKANRCPPISHFLVLTPKNVLKRKFSAYKVAQFHNKKHPETCC